MIDAAIEKAHGLVEALSYIQRFHDKTVVVKVGGSIMDDEQTLSAILTDIVFMNYVGMQPILVHGGGKAINQAMETAGLVPQMVMGRRYTDDRTLAIAEHVLCNQINRSIVNFIQSQGCEAMGLHSLSSNVLLAEKTFLQGPEGRLWPVWPAGFRGKLDEAGHVTLYDGGDNVVGRDGERVQASGSYSPPAAYAGEPCLPGDDGEVAAVQSEVTRVD